MAAVKLLGLAVLLCAGTLLLRAYRPALALPFVLAAGTGLLLLAVSGVSGVLDTLQEAFTDMGLELSYMRTALKVVGAAYVVQFASNICKDAGESALAGKVELVGRVMILAISVPVILDILEMLAELAGMGA